LRAYTQQDIINMNKPKITHQPHAAKCYDVNGSCSHYFGRLMSPAEVAEATIQQPPAVKKVTDGHWALCGDVSTEMYKLIQKAQQLHFPMRLSGFSSSNGVAYCALSLQVQRNQCRFLLPLYDPSVRSFIAAMTRSEHLTLSLGNDDGDQALLLRSPLKPNEYMPLLAMSSEATLDEQMEAVQELPTVQAFMGNPLQIPSLFPGYSVQHVSVSLLLPSILKDCCEEALVKAASK
jgi:hypothetical protein